MIVLNNVSFKYKNKYICKDFNYIFPDTGLYALKGKSGSGKTTLLNIISGFLSPSSGEITYSEDVMNLSNSTSIIFQDNNLFDHLTVSENIHILCRLNGEEYAKENINKVLSDLSIDGYLDTLVGNLSGGERQRVAIAIAILMDKKVILADEPFSSLDYDNSINIMKLFKELSKDRLIIFSSHNLSLLDDDVVTLDLENDSFSKKEECVSLQSKKTNKERLKPNTFLYIYHRIMGKRWVFRILSILFFSSLIFLLSFVLCLKGYTLEHVYVETINQNKIEFIDVNETQLDLTGHKYFKICGSTFSREQFGIEDSDSKKEKCFSLEPIKTGYLDDSLSETEIVLSDYSLYYLRYYDIVKFESPTEMIGKKINIFNTTHEFYLELLIKDIIQTPFLENYNNGAYENGEDQSYFIEPYASIVMNPYAYYYLNYYHDIDSLNVQRLELRNADNRFDFDVVIDDSLSDNEIVLNQYFCDIYQMKTNIQLEKNQNYEFDVTVLPLESTHGFMLKDIVSGGEPTVSGNYEVPGKYLMYMSKDTYMELQFETSPSNECFGYHIFGYENASELYKIFNQLDMRYKDENNVINNKNISFFGISKIEKVFMEIDHLSLALEVATIVIIGLLVIVSLYSSYSLYMLNKQRFQILEVYGMRRRYELYLLLFENILMIGMSAVIAIFCSVPSHMAFDNHLSLISKTNISVPTFNFGWFMLSVLIVCMFIGISVSLGYVLSLRRKIKSHIIK